MEKVLETYSSEEFITIKRKLEFIPKPLRQQYLKSLIGETTSRQTVCLNCYECVGWVLSKEEVENCQGIGCSFYAIRPRPSVAEEELED